MLKCSELQEGDKNHWRKKVRDSTAFFAGIGNLKTAGSSNICNMLLLKKSVSPLDIVFNHSQNDCHHFKRFNYSLKANFSKMCCLYSVLYFYLSKVVGKDFILSEQKP